MNLQIKYSTVSIFVMLLPLLLSAQYSNTNNVNPAAESGTQTHVGCKEVYFGPGYNYTPASTSDRMQAYIDPGLLCGEDYSRSGRGGGKDDGSGTGNININKGLPVGCIAGSFNVGASGAANYSIPLIVPPGTAGIKPNLGIVYSSQGGNGLLGLGFNLTGLSSITRVGQTVYHDGQTGGVNLDLNDRYSLDGQRLIVTSGTYGASYSEYHTESESFMLTTAYGTSGNGPSYFIVQTKEGVLMEYGNITTSANSQVLAQGKTTVLTWLLDKVIDLNGNYMIITYHNDNSNGEWWPETINYTGNVYTNFSPYNEVHFYYNKKASDKDNQFYYIAGSKEQQTVLLDNIQITANGQKVHEYDFNYSFDNYSRLVELVEKGADGNAYNSTVFNWGDSRKQDSLHNNHTYLFTNAATRRAGISKYRYVGDFDGDGAADILVAGINPDNTPAEKNHWVLYSSKGLFYQTIDASADDYQIPGNKFFKVTDGTLPADFADYVSAGQASLIGTVVDMNGDGKEDILLKKATSTTGHFDYAPYFSTGTGFTLGSTIVSPVATSPNTVYNSELLGDFDGDGKTDLIIVSENYIPADPGDPSYGIPATKEHTTITFYLYNDLKNSVSPVATTKFYDSDGDATGGTYKVMDFDGDGIMDIYTKINGNVNIIYYNSNLVGFTLKVGSNNITSAKYGKVFMGDFNADRHTDILAYDGTSNWTIQYATGNPTSPFVEKSAPSDLPPKLYDPDPNSITAAQEGIIVADFNGDGYADILNINNFSGDCGDGSGCTCFSSELAFFINTFNNTFAPKADHDYYYNSSSVSFCSNQNVSGYSIDAHWFNLYNYNLADFDGDGAMELECFYGGAFGYDPRGTVNADQWVMHHVFFSRFDKSRMVTSITDGFNKQITIDYDLLSSSVNVGVNTKTNTGLPKSYTASTSSVSFPVAKYRPSLYLVNESNVLYGNNTITTDYSYSDALFHVQGKGFMGFTTMTSYNVTTNTISSSTYDFGNSVYAPVLTNTKVNVGGQDVSSSSYSYNNDYALANKRFYIHPLTSQVNDLLHGTSVSNAYTFNANGNLTNQVVTYATNQVTDQTTTVLNSYEKVAGIWIESPLKTTSTTISRNNQTYSRNTTYTNNAVGKPTLITKDIGTNTTIAYDPLFGNISSTTTTGSDIATRVVSNTYDSKGRFIITQTNTLNQSAVMTYDDAYGNILSQKDINGLSTLYSYDGFGRLNTTTLPTQQIITTTRKWDDGSGPSGSLYTINSSQSGTAPVTEYYDILGRLIRKQTLSFDGTNLYVDKSYNSLGQLISESDPYLVGKPPQYTTYTYNPDMRLNKVNMASGSASTYAYTPAMPKTSITTLTGSSPYIVAHNSSKTLDATGAVITATDDGGTITYTYHPSGQPASITVPGTSKNITMTYDSYGRQQTLSDPDAGTTTYTYDVLGELLSQEDAKQKTTYNMSYDALGRILTKKGGPEGDVSYVYDTQTNGKGQLSSVTLQNGASKSYTYDGFSRLKSETETIDNIAFTTSYAYDNLSRMVSMSYPSTFQVTQSYNNNGYLEKVMNGNTTIWQTTGMNQFGEVTTAKYGNGSTITKTYDNFGFLKQHDIQQTGKSGLQRSYGYSFDATSGNLSSRSDLSKTPNLKESFIYDNIDRLKSSSGVAALSMTYGAASGSISTKSDVGTYGYSTSQPHAVTTISNPLNDTIRQIITYTGFNKVASISTANNGLMLTYGPDEQRCKAIYSSITGGVPTTYQTKYYAGSYEKTITTIAGTISNTTLPRQLDYIAGGDGLCALHVNNSGVDSIYYIMTDHLGSIALITDDKGNIADERNFDSWGRQRNPTDWTYTGVTGFKITDRGYTGHEHLNQFGIINMNGRCYDPVLGRMLSPDNFVQAPDNSQNFNRYSYCANNPLKYTDPTGEIFGIDDAVLGLIGGVVNLATHWGSIHNFGEGLGYFGVGFGAGALAEYISPVGSAALMGAGNGALGSYINTGHIDPGAVIQGAVVSGIIGGVTMGLGQALGPVADNALSGIASPVIRGAITQGVIGAGIGGVGGGLGAAMTGGNFWEGVGQGALWGAGIGLTTGAYSGYQSARAQGIDPWTGRPTIIQHDAPIGPAPYADANYTKGQFRSDVNGDFEMAQGEWNNIRAQYGLDPTSGVPAGFSTQLPNGATVNGQFYQGGGTNPNGYNIKIYYSDPLSTNKIPPIHIRYR